MNTNYTLPLDDQNANLISVGGKGASLARLVVAGLPVPAGFHITTLAYREFIAANKLQARIMQALKLVEVSHPETLQSASQEITGSFMEALIPAEVANAIVQAYENLPGSSPAVAVRSSATAEDLPEASFAGQQETYLNVRGSEAVLEATRKCWASLWTARAIAYRTHHGIPSESVALAVVIQLLIPADAAGILFTANPLNGRRDQVVVNASWGLGEAIVAGLVTPDTIVLDKSSGSVITRQTAKKLVQTVRVEGGTRDEPVPASLRQAPVLSDAQATELVNLGSQIEALYTMPMDIEWTLTQGVFAIVQARPITALPEPEFPVPTDWKLPKGAYIAMRNNIVELMADPLTPLFRTLGLNAVNSSFNRLLFGFFGRRGIVPDEPIIAVNQYAYYNGSIKFLPMIRLFLDAYGIAKRMFTGAVERWTEEGRPQYIATVDHWQNQAWEQLPATEILAAVRQLSEATIDAYGALVGGVIPAAWISEGFFTLVYKLVKRRGDPSAPTFLLGYDSLPIRAEKSLYDLAQWANQRPSLAAYLKEIPTAQIVIQFGNGQAPPEVDATEWKSWHDRFQAYLHDYGHMIYNLDFGNPTPADDPAPVLETFKLFLHGQGSDPHARQGASVDRRTAAIQTMQARLKGRRLKYFQKNLARAQKYAPLREDGLADVGLSYPLVRQMLRELGRRFVAGGMLRRADDIFWLIHSEVEDAVARLDRGEALEDLSEVVPQRLAKWNAARRAEPPFALPQMKVFGVDLMALKSGGARKHKGDVLKGVAASPGSVTGPACVVNGPQDFASMQTGEVLVAPLTTPAWTPLFARASAVVTDVGGPLSHGSIVAREYGIPAVLGTGAATKRIVSGQVITVNGSDGIVILSPAE